MFDVVLFCPEIPPNTGNAIRLAANTGVRLHLVEPLGFDLSDRQLSRAGLDYHDRASVRVHANWADCLLTLGKRRMFGFSTRGRCRYDQVAYRPDDVFVFGQETRGLPAPILASFGEQSLLRLPMCPSNRSMNLSNAVAVVVYESWRQQGFLGGG